MSLQISVHKVVYIGIILTKTASTLVEDADLVNAINFRYYE